MQFRTFATLLLTLCLTGAAWAVKPGTWTHQTEADFSSGKLDQTVVTNLGEVKLSLATTPLAGLKADDSIIYDIARLGDGRTFAAVGPEGKLAQLEDKKLNVIDEFKGAQVFALAAAGDGLWVGVSGAKSRLEFRSGPAMKVQRTIELPEDVRYVWDILIVKDHMYLATGDKGKVLELDIADKKPKPVVALDTTQDNILCLGADAQGRIYAGTDGEGLVYRITPQGGGKFSTFVVFDAPEPEIGALLVMPDGTVYAGTADASQARPGRLEQASTEQKGHPEKLTKQPTEPKLPNVPPKPEPKKNAPAEKPGPEAKAPEKPAAEAKAEPKEPDHAKAPAVAKAPEKPTAAQYAKLREAVAARLAEARKSGTIKLQAGGSANQNAAIQRLRSRLASGGRHRPGATPSKQGNAVYRISADGFVREVFRESVMILKIIPIDDDLLVATGNEGEIYRVSPDRGEVTLLADLEPQQIPAMLDLGGGKVLLGTANPGRILRLEDEYADSGTITSDPLDATQISLWGTMQIMASEPKGTSIEMQTRSGNISDPDAAGSWSDWSKPQTVDPTGNSFQELLSPSARFLQYRLTLHGKGKATPTVISVKMKYLMPNMPPTIASIKTDYAKSKRGGDTDSAAPAAQSTLKVEWEASDANDDTLTYTLEAKPFDAADAAPWVAIAKDLTDTRYEWDTRTTPDGRYLLRVTASDAADNVPSQALSATRRSDPVVVDNTPPDFKNIKLTAAKGAATLSVDIHDALSPIAEMRYTVDSDKDWHLTLPRDLIYDSTNESVVVKIPDLAPGSHVISLRASDAQGNTRYASKTVEIK